MPHLSNPAAMRLLCVCWSFSCQKEKKRKAKKNISILGSLKKEKKGTAVKPTMLPLVTSARRLGRDVTGTIWFSLHVHTCFFFFKFAVDVSAVQAALFRRD